MMRGVDGDPLTDDVAAPAKPALPEPIRQHSNPSSSWPVFPGSEGPAYDGNNPEDAEKIGGDSGSRYLNGLITAEQVHRSLIERGHKLERAAPFLPREEVRHGCRVPMISLRRAFPDHRKTIRIGKWE